MKMIPPSSAGPVGDLRRRPAGKGRRTDPHALDEVRALIPPLHLARDRLIESLHLIQDAFGALHARHLAALAELMRLSQAEVFEVASFYHHFDFVPEGGAAPAPLTLRVCDGVACMMAGAESLIGRLDSLVDPKRVRVLRAPCIGRCAEAPAACVGQNAVEHASAEGLAALAEAGETAPRIPLYLTLEAARAKGAYEILAECRARRRSVGDVIAALAASGLRGLGGAGFPASSKWTIVRDRPGPRLMTVNADEGEPGTFKDRVLLETDPHLMLEGLLIAAWAVEAERAFIYLRDEYAAVRTILTKEIAALEDEGIIAPGFIDLRRGAGAYICGEESAMLESIEGKRGLPRHRPPYIAENGLFGRPTLNHNVETLAFVPDILRHGAAWFADQGRGGAKGLRSFSVSGRVKEPGVKRAPAGITLHDLINEFCGGMAEGHALAGFLPGGASGGILSASAADRPLDFGRLDDLGAFVGSHAIVVFSDKDDVKALALNLIRFFRDESCGQCTPCRLGTAEMAAMLERGEWDASRLSELEAVMRDASICGLGQAAPNPVASVLRFFGGGGT